MQHYRITTLTTITPWTKTFETREDFHEWLKSMDLADGWLPYQLEYGTADTWYRWIEIQGKSFKTHKAEEYHVPDAA